MAKDKKNDVTVNDDVEVPAPEISWSRQLWAVKDTLIIILTPIILLPIFIVSTSRVSGFVCLICRALEFSINYFFNYLHFYQTDIVTFGIRYTIRDLRAIACAHGQPGHHSHDLAYSRVCLTGKKKVIPAPASRTTWRS